MDALAKALIQHLAQPMVVFEADRAGDWIIASISSEACALIGKPAEALVGCCVEDMFAGNGAADFSQKLARAVDGGLAEICDVSLAGPSAPSLHFRLTPCVDPNGPVARVIAAVRNSTPANLAQDMQNQMAAIDTDVQDFISIAAHDLRAPMRNVTQIAELLREDFSDLGDGKLELIDILEGVGVKAMHLIGEVLSYAQATSAVVETSEFDVAPLVVDLKDLLDPMGHHRFDAPDLRLEADRCAIQIILRNLMDNAIKYHSPKDAAESPLVCLLTITAGEDGMLDMAFHDNGQGFSPDKMAMLNGGSLRCDGGFGLVAVRRLIEARHGTLSVRNSAKGGCVRFTLPGRVVAETQAATQAA